MLSIQKSTEPFRRSRYEVMNILNRYEVTDVKILKMQQLLTWDEGRGDSHPLNHI